MKYESSVTETHKRILEEVQKCARGTVKVKRVKVEKPRVAAEATDAAEADGQAALAPVVKLLTPKQIEQVSKWKADISPMVAKVQEFQDEVHHEGSNSWSKYFPEHVHKLYNSLKLKTITMESDWALALDTENANPNIEFKKLSDGWKEFKGELKEIKRKYEVQMKEAKSMAGGA